MDFTKNDQKQEATEDDRYIKDMKDRMKIKQNQGMFDDRFQIFYQDSNEGNEIWVNHRMKQSLIFWANIFLFAATAKTVYPKSIKLVKKYLGLSGYLNLNMASVPFIFFSSSIVCGAFQGGVNLWQFSKEIQQYKK